MGQSQMREGYHREGKLGWGAENVWTPSFFFALVVVLLSSFLLLLLLHT